MRIKVVSVAFVLIALVCVCLARTSRTEKLPNQTGQAPARPSRERRDRKSLLKDGLQSLLPDVTVSDESVRDRGKPGEGEGYTMLRIAWDADDRDAPAKAEFFRSDPTPGPPLAGRTMRVTGRKKMKGGLAQPRGLDLSSEDVLMAAVDAGGRLRYWYTFADPRVVAEEALPTPGETDGRPRRTFHLSRVKFYIGVPDDPEITELRFYHPRWTGTEHVLDALGTIHF